MNQIEHIEYCFREGDLSYGLTVYKIRKLKTSEYQLIVEKINIFSLKKEIKLCNVKTYDDAVNVMNKIKSGEI